MTNKIYKAFEDILWNTERDNCTMETYMNKYIDSKRNVLSPSTITTYERLINCFSKRFLNIPLFELIKHNPFQTKPYQIPKGYEFLQAVKFNQKMKLVYLQPLNIFLMENLIMAFQMSLIIYMKM